MLQIKYPVYFLCGESSYVLLLYGTVFEKKNKEPHLKKEKNWVSGKTFSYQPADCRTVIQALFLLFLVG